MIPAVDYYKQLPKKRMGAGCLFFNEKGHVMLVKPTYKPGWEIAGGIVERNESPKRCCEREVLEEIGLKREIGRLLVVDYNDPDDPKTESLMFVFDGGTLTPTDIANIKLQTSELSEFAFFTESTLPDTMKPILRRRVLAAWQEYRQPTNAYFENQKR